MILNMTITGTSSTKSIMIISIDSGSTVAAYSDAACTTLVKSAVEKSNGEFWITNLNNGTYYIKATKNTDTRIISYTIVEYGVYRITLSYDTRPLFTYTGDYELVDDTDTDISEEVEWRENWKLRLLTSGTLNFSRIYDEIDVFLVGGGGGGRTANTQSGNVFCGGGAGGYTVTKLGANVATNTEYSVVVGAGGAHSTDGGASSFLDSVANGGEAGSREKQTCAKGGSGGGSGGNSSAGGDYYGSEGGSDGGGGYINNTTTDPTSGQGTTTREFGEANGTLYSGGGGSGCYRGTLPEGGAGGGGRGGNWSTNPVAGTTNLGGGGGGGGYNHADIKGASGGSGIVIIRNARS